MVNLYFRKSRHTYGNDLFVMLLSSIRKIIEKNYIEKIEYCDKKYDKEKYRTFEYKRQNLIVAEIEPNIKLNINKKINDIKIRKIWEEE